MEIWNIMADRNYLIFSSSSLDQVDFDQVMETSADSVRKSVDETKTFVKWEGSNPTFLDSLTGKEGPYTQEEILAILATAEWEPPMEDM
jgi:hypothetical protein